MKHRPCGNGKGDTPRPIKDREKFDSNWDAIFGNKKEEPKLCKPVCKPSECTCLKEKD